MYYGLLKQVNQATYQYLEIKGADVLDTIILEDEKPPAKHSVIVCDYEDAIHFCEVAYTVQSGDFNEEHMNRLQFEKIMLAWMTKHSPVEDAPIVFDQIDVSILGDQDSVIRHHINVF